MPANYTGDPTATQAPSPPPTPGVAPVGALPVDGDPPNGATFEQGFKVNLDFIAWMMQPRAAIGDWETPIHIYKDAKLANRAGFDPFGLPFGSYDEFRETWTPRDAFLQTGAGTLKAGRWSLVQTGAGSVSGANAPGVSANVNYSNRHTVLTQTVDSSAGGDKIEARVHNNDYLGRFHDDCLMVLRMPIYPNNVTNVDWVEGLTTQSEDIASIAHGAFFINVGGATWKARTIDGGAPTETDTGISGAAGTEHLLGIAYVGANVAADSTRRVLFFVDGVLKANHTANITDARPAIPIVGGFSTGASGLARQLVGPIHYAQINAAATPTA